MKDVYLSKLISLPIRLVMVIGILFMNSSGNISLNKVSANTVQEFNTHNTEPLTSVTSEITQTQQPFTLSLPWEYGKSWSVSSGFYPAWPTQLSFKRIKTSPHRYTNGGALDFFPENGNPNLLVAAAGSGTVTLIYDKVDTTVACAITITHGNTGYTTEYRHLRNLLVTNGQWVNTGDPLAKIIISDEANPATCGDWAGRHLHFLIRGPGIPSSLIGNIYSWPITLTGWNVSFDVTKNVTSFTKNQQVITKNYTLIKNVYCPLTEGEEVIFYRYPNYNCGGKPEGEGFIRFDPRVYSPPIQIDGRWAEGSVFIPGSSTSTIRYSVIMAEDQGSRTVQIIDSDNNLLDNFYRSWPGYLISFSTKNYCSTQSNSGSATNGVTTDCTPNVPPNTPKLISPATDSVINSNVAPTLCWQSQGDPNGHQQEYYVDINGTTNSGWISNTCWRPAQLDNKYNNYVWKVKARDSLGAESNFSPAWNFTLKPLNYPPEITFATANGDNFPSGLIITSNQNFTFTGQAYDPEGQLSRVEWGCGSQSDNCGINLSQSGTNEWSHSRVDMAGRNDIYFVAYDAYGNKTVSRHLDLRIDIDAPVTALGLNSNSDEDSWPTWFTSSVLVNLSVNDKATGKALSGPKQLQYRLDNGQWNTVTGANHSFYVETDGTHTIDYFATDNVGNQETTKSITFKIDLTPPSDPTIISETNGVPNDQWQNNNDIPVFTWDDGVDALSGMWGYQLYFGSDPNGVGFTSLETGGENKWIPQAIGVITGTYYFRGRTRDIAGNWSPWSTWFVYKFDGTPPENPVNIVHSSGLASTIWQKTARFADFSWSRPLDEGSGIKGYYVSWSKDVEFIDSIFITDDLFASLEPLCGASEACIGYFRIRSVDNVGNLANDWSTLFELRYDNAPPTLEFSINDGNLETFKTSIYINIDATDQGSGVWAMRLSSDGNNWTDWEAYSTKRSWSIPSVGRQHWPVYVQVKDWVDLSSPVEVREIYLETNIRQPKSQSYWLTDGDTNSGSSNTNSPSYMNHNTLGQNYQGDPSTSTHYRLLSGYEAGSQAIPLIQPQHDDYFSQNQIFASGNRIVKTSSESTILISVVGEFGLAKQTSISSATYSHQPGFLAAHPSDNIQIPENTPGELPEPNPVVSCNSPSILINNGDPFTNKLDVKLQICAPQALEMKVSNNREFINAEWEPYTENKQWTLLETADYSQPLSVYIRFKNSDNVILDTYFDEILFDPTRPFGEIFETDDVSISPVVTTLLTTQVNDNLYETPLLQIEPDKSVLLYFNSFDDYSGVEEVQLSLNPDFSDASWEPFNSIFEFIPPDGDGFKNLFFRLKDQAGNTAYSDNFEFIYDATAPTGSITFEERIISSNKTAISLYLYSIDRLYDDSYEENEDLGYEGTVQDMRVSYDPGFTDVSWQPYTDLLILPVNSDPGLTTVYVQFRDQAGNISDTYSDTYIIDDEPPIISAITNYGDTATRLIYLNVVDNESDIYNLRISNDPLFENGVIELEYTEVIEWTFDERNIAWIQASDAAGNWSSPYPVNAYSLGSIPISIPTGINASDGVYLDKVHISWATTDGATFYEVFRNTSDTLSEISSLGTTDQTLFEDITAEPGLNFWYFVKACNEIGCSDFSLSDSGYRAINLSTPIGVVASDGAFAEKVHISWEQTDNALYYEVYNNVLNNSDGSSLLGTSSGTFFDDTSIIPGTVMWYFIKACENNNCSEFSLPDSGWYGISPVMGEKLNKSKVGFDWYDIAGATEYVIRLSTKPDFSSLVFKTRTPTSDYFYYDYLKYNTDYYWQIRPIVDKVKGPWSSVFKFSSMNPLLAPIILTPINKALQTTNPSIFEWEQVENATGYKIVIAKDLAFTIKEQIGTGDSTSFEGSLKSGKYFWRVRAFDFYGAKSPWSEVRIIKILLE